MAWECLRWILHLMPWSGIRSISLWGLHVMFSLSDWEKRNDRANSCLKHVHAGLSPSSQPTCFPSPRIWPRSPAFSHKLASYSCTRLLTRATQRIAGVANPTYLAFDEGHVLLGHMAQIKNNSSLLNMSCLGSHMTVAYLHFLSWEHPTK